MTAIIEGMTPAQFITALNTNYAELNTIVDDIATLTTCTTAMTSGQLKTAIDNNVTALNDCAFTLITTSVITIGMGGALFISSLNNDFVRLNNIFNTPVTQENTIYVSNSGNNLTGDGSSVKPYLTLAKISSVITDSTKLLLAKDSTFTNDKLDLSGKRNVFVDSYGSGSAPILTGLKTVTGWTDLGGNIWSHQDDNFPTEITNVFISGTKAVLARTAGWKTATAGSNTTLTDSSLTDADGYWDNAELVVRYYVWANGISRVSAYASKQFTIPVYYQNFETSYIYPVKIGDSYFIQNHIHCLTTQDTWAYNNSTQTLYIYSVAEPANITATYGDDCIFADSARHITIQNLTINSSARCSVNINDSLFISIDNLIFNYSGISSNYIRGSKNVDITNCTGTDQNGDFILSQYCTNITIEDNVIYKCGFVSGTERYLSTTLFGGDCGSGIAVHYGINVLVKYNHISYMSYMGIWLAYSDLFTVENNYVHHITINKTDGGAIYIVSKYPGSTAIGSIKDNILTDGIVTVDCIGIYLDFDIYDIECYGNFIEGYKYNYLLSNSNGTIFHDNTLFSNVDEAVNLLFRLDEVAAIDNEISNNLFIVKEPATLNISVNSASVRAETISGNKYYSPFKVAGGDVLFKIVSTQLTLAEWIADDSRADWNRDTESEITPSLYDGSAKPTLNFLIFLTNPAKTARVVTEAELPYNDYLDMDGVAQSYPFNIDPYGSKVLVRPN